jgi:phosphinothricin acetyltransferase
MNGISIRPGRESDLSAINSIYNYYVINCTCTFAIEPETDESRLQWFRAHGERHPVIVAECDSDIVGWGALSKFKDRAAYDNSVEASVYIRHDCLGRSVGRLLLVDLIQRAKTLGHHTLIGGACTEKAASMRLQEALGFQQVACFREVGYKFGRWLDVAYFQLMLGDKSVPADIAS